MLQQRNLWDCGQTFVTQAVKRLAVTFDLRVKNTRSITHQSNELSYLIKNSLTWRNNTKVTITGTALNILKKVPAFEFEMILC